ncbi:MAG: OmpA family protein [Paracoccaceae bacterium]
MRTILGLAFLALGLGGLGYYAHGKTAVEIENGIAARSLEAVAASIHPVVPEVSGRDIHLTGIADTESEREALLAAANAVEGRRVVTEALTVLPVASPYAASVTKAAPPAALVGAGVVPSGRAQEELAGAGWGEAAASLTLASGAPEGWLDLAKAGVAALAPLETGEMEVSDATLVVKGVALSPVEYGAMEAALAGLPEGAVTLDVTLLDDGTPPAFQVVYDVLRGGAVSGKFPPGLDIAMLAEALGLPELGGASEVKQGILGDPVDIGPFASLSRYLPDLERLQIDAAPGQIAVAAEAGAGIDLEAMQAAMQTDMGPDVTLSVTRAVDNGMNGDTRTNAATGLPQRYAGGYWLAVPDFVADRATCQAQTQAVLDGATINFVSGSDVLDASAVGVLNDLGAVILKCAEMPGLRAVIGGHTDNTGDALMNLGLSQKRATAVRLALVERGVPGGMLKAIGFGAEQPIADNGTEEGKALNRRTTIDWVE